MYKRQGVNVTVGTDGCASNNNLDMISELSTVAKLHKVSTCLLYTSDAADDLLCVDLGGRRIIKKKKNMS